MKSFVVLCLILVAKIHSAISLSQLATLPQIQNDNVTQLVDQCLSDIKDTVDMLYDTENYSYIQEDALRKLQQCFRQKTGFMHGVGGTSVDIDLLHLPRSPAVVLVKLCKFNITQNIEAGSVPDFSACYRQGALADYYNFVSVFPGQNVYFYKIIDICRIETGYTDDVLDKEEKNGYTEDRGLRLINKCFLEETGFITKDEKLNIDVALDKLPPGFVKPIIEYCKWLMVIKILPEDVPNFYNCYHKSILNHYYQFVSKFPSRNGYLKSIVAECRNKVGYTNDVLDREKKTDLVEDEGLKNFTKCFLEITDFISSDGKLLNTGLAKAKLPLGFAKSIISDCDFTTAPELISCFHEGLKEDIRKAEREGREPFTRQ